MRRLFRVAVLYALDGGTWGDDIRIRHVGSGIKLSTGGHRDVAMRHGTWLRPRFG